MHFCDLVTSKNHKCSSIKEIKEIKEGLCNNVDLGSAKDPPRYNTIPLMRPAG